jgi:DNA-3-methyladenine glycosylase II
MRAACVRFCITSSQYLCLSKRQLASTTTTMAETRKRQREAKELLDPATKTPRISFSSSETIDRILFASRINDSSITTTKAGWCLREGLEHVISVNEGKLLSLIEQHGIPPFYLQSSHCRHDNDEASPQSSWVEPKTCFQSLCRIIAGQQLAGAAARTVWKRLLETTSPGMLSPEIILMLEEQGAEKHLQKPAGLSRAKAGAIVTLAKAFQDGELSEEFLLTAEEDVLRAALLQIKGIGPWTCDMFAMFYLHQPNILPLGDLGVRKGMQRCFALTGKGKKGTLCANQDATRMRQVMEPYRPYQSLVTYYMWRVADTPDFYNEKKKSATTPGKKSGPNARDATML